MLAQGFLDLFFDTAPHLEHLFLFFELSTKAAFATAAFAEEKKAYTACSSAELFFAEKKWGLQRKDFGGRYGLPGFIGFLYPPPAWKVFL